jgi:hypothetical protein
MKHGIGELITAEGTKVDGTWIHGKINGGVVILMPSGMVNTLYYEMGVK